MKSALEVHFSRCSLASEFFAHLYNNGLDLIRHLFNFSLEFLYWILQIQAQISKWICFLAETKARSDYDVIEGNDVI